MTEYNQQNNQIKKVRSSNDSIFDQPIYQHYKVLLKKAIANAFAAYLKIIRIYLVLSENHLKQMR